VPSLPLIASSIMSKKLAGGANAIVLDVKVGRGAFMETLDEARALAELMIRIGEGVGRDVTAVLSDMSQPLGRAVGNAVEVREAIRTLRSRGPDDLVEHCVVVAAEMLVLGGVARDAAEGRALAESALADGSAWARFRRWVGAQGGDVGVVDDDTRLPAASLVHTVPAPRSGYVAAIDAREVGLTAVDLGAGRQFKGQAIDHGVGIVLSSKVGDEVAAGEPLCTIHARDEAGSRAAEARLLKAYRWAEEPVEPPPLVYGVIGGRS